MQKSAEQWEDRLNLAGIPAARVRHLNETLHEPQVAARKVLQRASGLSDEHAHLKMPVAAFSFAHNGPQLKTHAPLPGQHSREVLLETGMTDQVIDELLHRGVIAST